MRTSLLKRALCALLILCVSEAYSQEGTLAPLPQKQKGNLTSRFNLQIAGGFNNTLSQIDSKTTSVYSTEGAFISSEKETKESIDFLNKENEFHFDYQMAGLRLSYRIVNQFGIWGGIGVAHQSGHEEWAATDDVSVRYTNGTPSLYYEGGLSYGYAFNDHLFAKIQPGVFYTRFSDVTVVFDEGDNQQTLPSYSLDRSYLQWEGALIVGYAIGKFVPYLGISYKDYVLTDKHEVTKHYVGEDYCIKSTYKMNSRSKIHGMAGVEYFFAKNIAIGLSGSFSRNISALLTFNIGL